ncbi:tyrosine-type recombinase/integrase [Rickettsiella endosymbiont of Dermanyssus gallinae]|uniref:tyrosine-type recombinase/integrase n=1 Tax=Rickettsiella endosymbiont of Dermanyssus gallinae TaxID=2856608 RepID=UPI001C52B624|nr:site-specific integrase [Rickettsiella endosymbiont of Dermanyssus gallinae]
MALWKRNKIWWIQLSHNGDKIQKSTGTTDKIAAQELHDRLKAELWRQDKLKEKPKYIWQDAVVKWLDEVKDKRKRSMKDVILQLNWVDPHLKDKKLIDIDRVLLEKIAKIKEKRKVSPSTVNRMLEIVRAILNKAANEWEWIEKVPKVPLRYEGEGRDRWLTKREANLLLAELPTHLADIAAFSLATGLRKANVLGLQWKNVDLANRHAQVSASQSKTRKAIPVPLNTEALTIIRKQIGKHNEFVFTYRGKPIRRCNTHAWRKALKRAKIDNFRWHDLRHTWASWHVQNGTSLQELQQLGGWSSFDIVLRYAHLNSDHLKKAAERIVTTNLLQFPKQHVLQAS